LVDEVLSEVDEK